MINNINMGKEDNKMKKFIKVVLCLVLLGMLCFAPKAVNDPRPGPDDRPISYAYRVNPVTEVSKAPVKR